MGKKFFTISFDDGTAQDRRIIALMERYGIRGTFHLSSGLFGKKSYIHLTGGRGKSAAEKDPAHPEEYVDHFILSEQEALELYARPNVEVAGHGTHHLVQTELSPEEAEEEISRDFEALSKLFGVRIVGHAFPKGTYNDHVLAALRRCGARYARCVRRTPPAADFSFDKNELVITPTCRHTDPCAQELLQRFIETPVKDDDLVFFLWGHSYELDYGTPYACDAHLEQLFRMVSEAKDVCCVTNRELFGV